MTYTYMRTSSIFVYTYFQQTGLIFYKKTSIFLQTFFFDQNHVRFPLNVKIFNRHSYKESPNIIKWLDIVKQIQTDINV